MSWLKRRVRKDVCDEGVYDCLGHEDDVKRVMPLVKRVLVIGFIAHWIFDGLLIAGGLLMLWIRGTT